MWLRIAAVSDVAYIRGAVQALYRIHTDSMLRSMLESAEGAVKDLRERRSAFEAAFAEFDGRVHRVDRLRALVTRRLARQALWQASRAYDRGEVEGPEAVPVEDLVAFALETFPGTRRLREWWGLRLRRRIGAGRSLWFVPFIATGAAHRLRGHVDRMRWRTYGI